MSEEFEKGDEQRVLKRVEYEGGEAVIRHPKPEDIDGVLDIVMNKREIWKETGQKEDVIPITDGERDFRKRIIEAANKGKMVFLVIEADGKICGYVDIRRSPDINKDPADMGTEPSDRVTGTDVTVHGDYRGKHFATALVETALEEAKNVLGAKIAELQTDEDNVSARKAYENLGFKVKSIGPDTKKRKDKTVLRVNMEKEL